MTLSDVCCVQGDGDNTPVAHAGVRVTADFKACGARHLQPMRISHYLSAVKEISYNS